MEQIIILNKEQLEIVNAPLDEKTIVVSAAAVGKTACLTERIKFLLKNHINPYKIVAFTYTNNAAIEIKKRIINDGYRVDGLFIGTIHSYCSFKLQQKREVVSSLLALKDFDGLIYKAIKRDVFDEVDYLLCDEAQDLNPICSALISKYIPYKGCLLVGDPRQSIFEFNGGTGLDFIKLSENGDFRVRQLFKNYRNGKAIVGVSNELIKNLPLPTNLTLSAIEPMAEHNGSILRLQPNSIPQVLKQNGEWGKWAILCKTNVGIKVASKQLSFQGVPNVPLIIDSEEKRDINEQLFTNKVKVLTVHSAKGLEFDNVILNEAYQESKENLKLMYVAITRAKNRVYLK